MAVYARFKKANFDYEILDDYEAGIVLTGAEVKSVRSGGANLSSSFVHFEKDGAYLYGVDIQKWQGDNNAEYDPFRKRKILLKKKEIEKLQKKSEPKGNTVIPLKIYTSGKYIKVTIALVRARRKHEKSKEKKKQQNRRESQKQVKEALLNN